MINIYTSPDRSGNFAGKNNIIFWTKRATKGSSFWAMKINYFDKKLERKAGIATKKLFA